MHGDRSEHAGRPKNCLGFFNLGHLILFSDFVFRIFVSTIGHPFWVRDALLEEQRQ